MSTNRPLAIRLQTPFGVAAVLAVANTLHGPEARRPVPPPDEVEGRRVIDRLRRWPDARRFLVALGLPLPPEPPTRDDELRLRSVRAAVRALAEGDTGGYARRVRQLLSTFAYRVEGDRLIAVGSGWPALLGSLVVGLVALEPQADRLRECRNAACGWVFLDASPNGRQLWCATQLCGPRVRVRRHRRRARAASATT